MHFDVNLAGAVNGSIRFTMQLLNNLKLVVIQTHIIMGDARYFRLSATNLPDTDGTYDIGSSTFEYRNIYARKVYAQATTVETLNGATGGTITGALTVSGDITASGTLGGTFDLSSSSIGTLSDVNLSGIQNNEILKWNSATSSLVRGTINSDEALKVQLIYSY